MKYVLLIIFCFFPLKSFASCFKEIISSDVKLSIEHISNSVDGNTKHSAMDAINVQVLSQYQEAKLETMLLTKGEVAEFWYPIAFNVKDGLALTTLSGDEASLHGLEMVFYYKDNQCSYSIQIML